jgi:hypothetical protein
MPGVEGLNGNELNVGPDGSKINVTRFDADGTIVPKPGEALSKRLDPDHSKNGVQGEARPRCPTIAGCAKESCVQTRSRRSRLLGYERERT